MLEASHLHPDHGQQTMTDNTRSYIRTLLDNAFCGGELSVPEHADMISELDAIPEGTNKHRFFWNGVEFKLMNPPDETVDVFSNETFEHETFENVSLENVSQRHQSWRGRTW